MLLGNAQVAGQRTLQTTAHRIAVDGSNRHAPKRAQGLEGFAEATRSLPCSSLVAVGKLLQIGAGTEELLSVASDHQRVDAAVRIQRADQIAQGRKAVHGPGIGRRIAQGDDGDMAVAFDM